MYSQHAVLDLLTSQGGVSAGLHFPNCPNLLLLSRIAIAFKSGVWPFLADFFYSAIETKGRGDDSREAYFTCYLKKLHGDHGRIQILAANYELANGMDLDKDSVAEVNIRNPLDACSVIEFGNDRYTNFVNNVDTVFQKTCTECYGHFVSLTVNQGTTVGYVQGSIPSPVLHPSQTTKL
jgi:hypothetical protein